MLSSKKLKHGEIKVSGDKIELLACHVNPIFYKKSGNNQSEILLKDQKVTLYSNDKFSLLPESVIEYEIRVVEAPEGNGGPVEPTPGELRVRNIVEINENLEAGIATSISQIMANTSVNNQTDMTTHDSDSDRTPSDLERSPSPDFLATVSTEPSNWRPTRKRSIDENGEEGKKKLKSSAPDQIQPHLNIGSTSSAQPEIANISAPSSSVTQQQQPISIKPDPDAQIAAIVAAISVDPVAVKPDPDHKTGSVPNIVNAPENPMEVNPEPDEAIVQPGAVKTEPPVALPTLRPSCLFGVRCYRTADDHRREFAHPTDADYRRPDFPPAPAGTPDCPFGASCYRRNPDHFVRLQHPSSSES